MIVVIGLLGLAVGSFLNVVAHRVPIGMKVSRPASACPSCGTRIGPRDNIPVISWVLLRGRCRHCRTAIPLRYPLLEAATSGVFVGVAVLVGFTWVLPAYLWSAAVALALVATDFEHKRIPNRILYPGTAIAVILFATGSVVEGDADAFLRGAAGGAAYFGGLLLLALVARGGFGFGDVKLGFLLGLVTAYQSWDSLVVAVFVAFLFGGLVAVALLILRRAGKGDAIPFGPSLVLGAAVAVAWGDAIADWYLG